MQALRETLARRFAVVDGPQRRMLAWILSLGICAVTLGAVLGASGWSLGHPLVVGFLIVVATLAERSRVRLSNHIETSISVLPTLFAGVLFGPLAAMAVSGGSMLIGGFSRKWPSPYLRWMTYSFSRSVAGALTGLSAVEATRIFTTPSFLAIAVGTGVGAIVSQVLDVIFASCTLWLRRVGDPRDVFRTLGPLVLSAVPLYTPLVAFLAFAYSEVSAWTVPLFFVPALAAQRLFGLYQEQRRLAEDLASANVRLERAGISFATALVATLDARDRYTAGHSAAVAIYARDIAKRMGLGLQSQELAHLCGLVHDIGKIGLPPGLLEKPGALSLEERRQMQEHSAIGERILAKVEDYADIAHIVRHHHERMDGMGYPDGIAGGDIPIVSRIIAVADAYNAMTSDRPYRDAMPTRIARMRLAQGVEGQFDTHVVAAFEAILAGSDEAYRTGTARDFTFDDQERYVPASLIAQVA